eukprot:Nitzschia sp. Nitz4//scaffold6_size259037//79594//80859//NITZ4_001060-RA/size259037-processed-gene-0.9-mRNA-1//1//CDS//3329556851//4020//frame0
MVGTVVRYNSSKYSTSNLDLDHPKDHQPTPLGAMWLDKVNMTRKQPPFWKRESFCLRLLFVNMVIWIGIETHYFQAAILDVTPTMMSKVSASFEVEPLPDPDNGPTLDPNDELFHTPPGWDTSFIIIKQFRLAFWTTPKIATTAWKKLFRCMSGGRNCLKADPHDPGSNGLTYLHHLPRSEQQHILSSPKWTKALFIRDPMERALSAYLDKAARNNASHVMDHCCGITPDILPMYREQEIQKKSPKEESKNDGFLSFLRGWEQEQQGSSDDPLPSRHTPDSVPYGSSPPSVCNHVSEPISFETFLTDVLPSCSIDAHWRPQTKQFSRQLREHINFVGRFSHLVEDAETMLRQVGAWEPYLKEISSLFLENAATHKTHSQSQMREYYSSEKLRQSAIDFYREDYVAWSDWISPPFSNRTKEY